MTSAAKLRRNFIHVYFVTLGTKAEARQFRLDFFEEARDDHRLDGANVIDQTFRIVRLGAGAGVVGFLEPEVSDLVIMRETEVIEHVAQQAHPRERIGLVNFVANLREVRPTIKAT
jgi:hypothetical protein